MAHEVLVSIGGVARRLGVSVSTVRNYERAGVLVPAMRVEGSDRRVWRESDLSGITRRPTQIRPSIRSGELPTEAA